MALGDLGHGHHHVHGQGHHQDHGHGHHQDDDHGHDHTTLPAPPHHGTGFLGDAGGPAIFGGVGPGGPGPVVPAGLGGGGGVFGPEGFGGFGPGGLGVHQAPMQHVIHDEPPLPYNPKTHHPEPYHYHPKSYHHVQYHQEPYYKEPYLHEGYHYQEAYHPEPFHHEPRVSKCGGRAVLKPRNKFLTLHNILRFVCTI